jgi:hypothetical protein
MRRNGGMRKSVSGRKKNSEDSRKRKQPRSASSKTANAGRALPTLVSMVNSLVNIKRASLVQSRLSKKHPRADASRNSNANLSKPKKESVSMKLTDQDSKSRRVAMNLDLGARAVNVPYQYLPSQVTTSLLLSRNAVCCVRSGRAHKKCQLHKSNKRRLKSRPRLHLVGHSHSQCLHPLRQCQPCHLETYPLPLVLSQTR